MRVKNENLKNLKEKTMEDHFENSNHRIEIIEDTLQNIIKTLSDDYKKLHDHLADFKTRKIIEQEENKKFLEFLEQNNKALEHSQSINQSHFEAQHYIKEQTEILKEVFQKTYIAFSESFEVFVVHIKLLNSQIEKIPSTYSIDNHHHIEPRSKGLLALLITLVFLSVAGIAWGFVNYITSQELKADQIKYRMFRQQLPHLNQQIDSIFYENPERAQAVVSKLEAETELRKAANLKRREADQAAQEAVIIQHKGKKY